MRFLLHRNVGRLGRTTDVWRTLGRSLATWGIITVLGLGSLTIGALPTEGERAPAAGFETQFCAAADPSLPAGIDLVGLTTTYRDATDLRLTLEVAGTLATPGPQYGLSAVAGNLSLHGAASVTFVNLTAARVTYYASTGDRYATLPSSRTTSQLMIDLNASLLGSPGTFGVNAEGTSSGNPTVYSFLGTSYNRSGSESCPAGGPTDGGRGSPGPTSSLGGEGLTTYAILGVVVGALLVLGVLIAAIVRGRPPTPPGPPSPPNVLDESPPPTSGRPPR